MNNDDYEQFRQTCMADCPDVAPAVLDARNCLLYEADSEPAKLQATFLPASLSIPCSEAWQLSYAMVLLDECGGDAVRLGATDGVHKPVRTLPQSRRWLGPR